MTDPSQMESRHRDVPRGPGPIVLLLPVLSLAFGVLWAKKASTPWGGPRPRPPVLSEVTERDAWVGEAEHASGRLIARLVPIHESSPRLIFERDALASRLALGPGRPWRLELELHGQETGGDPLELAGLPVVHSAGRLELAVFEHVEPGPAEVADPLRTLLAPPPGGLAPGHELPLVLWGPVPEGQVKLLVDGLELELGERRVPVEVVSETLARLDRGDER